MARIQGRITREDVKEAGFRKWDGQQRITTDWINLFHEPELCFADGDCLVYLRDPGQSSRGPAFRIHAYQLKQKRFHCLLDRCIARPPKHSSPKCALNKCSGCEQHPPLLELYIPAPPKSDLTAIFEYHITTRNFFAWLYDKPLAGSTLGESLVNLKYRIDCYRPNEEIQNRLEVVSYAESQKYLDFRECADHALAVLYLAETLEIQKLYVDAFAHCVGMRHRGLKNSKEYNAVSAKSKSLINKARGDMDERLDRVFKSVYYFFEDDSTCEFLGLHSAARDHLDRFRSFLHGFYIEQNGFWPPENFNDEQVQKQVYNNMYYDFRNLYHHLANPKSTADWADPNAGLSGGVCTLQNVRAFDHKHGYDSLPYSTPMLPSLQSTDMQVRKHSQRRNSWNLLTKRKIDRDTRHARSMQALIDSTNRDWNLMSSVLVRRYSEFEVASAVDELEDITLVDGRKVRWILIYSILQTLISVVQAPKEVRNTEGLTYSLCCKSPSVLPWIKPTIVHRHSSGVNSAIAPDTWYSHTNASTSTLGRSLSWATTIKERRQTWAAAGSSSTSNRPQTASRSGPRPTSFIKFMPKRSESLSGNIINKRPAYCEIMVKGYGNGLNECRVERSLSKKLTGLIPSIKKSEMDQTNPIRPDSQHLGSPMVSRESSNASNNSGWSKGSSGSDTDLSSPDSYSKAGAVQLILGAYSNTNENGVAVNHNVETGDLRVLDENNESQSVHINTKTWDALLGL